MGESPDIRIAQLEQARDTLLAVTEQAEKLLDARDKRIGELEAAAVEHAVRHRQVYDEQARTIADLRSEVNHLSVALEAAESDLRDVRAERDELRERLGVTP